MFWLFQKDYIKIGVLCIQFPLKRDVFYLESPSVCRDSQLLETHDAMEIVRKVTLQYIQYTCTSLQADIAYVDL